MRHLCDHCQYSHPVTMDHTTHAILCECINCGNPVRFGRVQKINSSKISCKLILAESNDEWRIRELKSEISFGFAGLVKRDIIYHNLLILVEMEHSCHRCNHSLPVRFSRSGKHVKASCGHCGFYIKFVPQGTIPNYQESRNKIWALTQNLAIINEAKLKIGIHDQLVGMDRDLQWHNCYTHIVKNNFV